MTHAIDHVCFGTFCYEREAEGPRRARRALGARRAPKPSAGARRRGVEHPELLVSLYFLLSFVLLYCIILYCTELYCILL